jgi:hypothetical protein
MAALGAVHQGQQVVEFAYTPAPRVERRFDGAVGPISDRLYARGEDICAEENRRSEYWRRRRARWGRFTGF